MPSRLRLIAAAAIMLAPAGGFGADFTGLQFRENGVRLFLTAPVAHSVFRLSGPDRVVVDLEGAGHGAPVGVWASPGGAIARARSSLYQKRPVPVTRIVLELNEVDEVWTETDGAVIDLMAIRPEKSDMRDALAPLAVPGAAAFARGLALPPGALGTLRPPSKITEVVAGKRRAEIRLDRAPAYRARFAFSPPRLIIDLLDTSLGGAPAVQEGDMDLFRRVSTIQSSRFPRKVASVVFDLWEPVRYWLTPGEERLSVRFEERRSGASARGPRVPERRREFRGYVFDDAGLPKSGTFLITFSLPDDPGGQGGGWKESLYVRAVKGWFHARLGATAPLPPGGETPERPIEVAPPPGTHWHIVPR